MKMSSNLSIFLAFYSKWTTSREKYDSVFIVLTTYDATEWLLFYKSVVTKTTKNYMFNLRVCWK